jgi:transposase
MAIIVDYRDTLVTYLNSETVQEAAKNLNVSVATLKSRLATLRSHGVKIPAKTPNPWSDLNIAQYNALVKKHTAKTN